MKPWLRYALLLMVLYMLFLAGRFPASQALGLLQQRVAAVTAAGVTGTVWQGQASSIRLGRLQLDQVRWRLLWLRLVRGELAVLVTGEQHHGRFDVVVGQQLGDGLFIRDQGLPVAQLDQLLFDRPWGVSGSTDLDLHGIRFAAGHLRGIEGEVVVHGLGLSAPASLPLGDYRAMFSSTGQGINIALQDVNAALGVTGSVEVRPDGSYVMNMKFQARDPGNRDLMQILQLLGSGGAPQATLNRSGPWPY
ncbi:MAG: type II secretion system protein N [Gammaproteobacteria bacterium]|nr:type II secretion system protein N [Gammaproteobacteria bacterium]